MGKGTSDWGLGTRDWEDRISTCTGANPVSLRSPAPSKGRGENVRVRSKRLVIESVAEKSFLQTDK